MVLIVPAWCRLPSSLGPVGFAGLGCGAGNAATAAAAVSHTGHPGLPAASFTVFAAVWCYLAAVWGRGAWFGAAGVNVAAGAAVGGWWPLALTVVTVLPFPLFAGWFDPAIRRGLWVSLTASVSVCVWGVYTGL